MPTPPSHLRSRGWIVVATLFMVLAVGVTGRNSIGLMMPVWKDDLGWSYSFISGAAAAMMTVMAIVAPVGGWAIDRYGPRVVFGLAIGLTTIAFGLCAAMTEPWQLMALFGILAGISFAIISPSIASTTVFRYFDRNLGLATSIASSGSTGGQLALMPLLGVLVVSIGWRSTYLAMAAGMALLLIATLIVLRDAPARPRPPGGGMHDSLGTTLRRLGRDRTFWLLGSGFFICGFTTAGVIKIHLIPYAVACGFPPLQSATAYGVLSLFSLLGMIAYGHLSDRFHRPMLLASIYFMRALTFILLMQVAGNLPALYIFAVLFGIFDYATFPIVASLVASHLGRHIMGISMGLIFGAHSLGGASGSFLGGYLFDLSGRYDWVWVVAMAMATSAGVLTLMIKETRPRLGATVAA